MSANGTYGERTQLIGAINNQLCKHTDTNGNNCLVDDKWRREDEKRCIRCHGINDEWNRAMLKLQSVLHGDSDGRL